MISKCWVLNSFPLDDVSVSCLWEQIVNYFLFMFKISFNLTFFLLQFENTDTVLWCLENITCSKAFHC